MIDKYTLNDVKCYECNGECTIHGLRDEFYKCNDCDSLMDRVVELEKTIEKLLGELGKKYKESTKAI